MSKDFFREGIMKAMAALLVLFVNAGLLGAHEFHVSVKGDDAGDGSEARPLRTIMAAARLAQPGDMITVHAGTYRERITPPRGGRSDSQRITYQAAPGERVEIKGSEIVKGWQNIQPGVWKVTLPNTFFKDYNPYKDLIVGDWFTDKGRPHHTGEVYLNGKSLFETHLLTRVLEPQPYPEARDREASTWTWHCASDEQSTTITAHFHDKDPNRELVEINVRPACFYPDQPGRDFLTIRGFHFSQAATQWAAPTAEQIGLIGTFWSKGWIIEKNEISDSKCSGITLGKDRATGNNVWINNPAKDGCLHYNEVIERALKIGWSRDTIGSHIVRNNFIHDCEQTGICGSLGAIFSQITDNHIYRIWAKRQFTGAEMAGIKLHGAIDVLIEKNRIHNAGRGIWLDWMAQGTRVTRNLLYDNTTDDLFVEVNHGPFLVDHNIFLSPTSLLDMSEGGAFAHNLFGGLIVSRPEPNRKTPHHAAHATALAGLCATRGGDNRFFNNIFVGRGPVTAAGPQGKLARTRDLSYGLKAYDARPLPLLAEGNLYWNHAQPYARETGAMSKTDFDPAIQIREQGPTVLLAVQGNWERMPGAPVTTERLGKTAVGQLPYEGPDGSRLLLDRDYFGKPRGSQPAIGPFENPRGSSALIQVW